MTRVAAIDCGTNSIRLLISDIDEENGTAVDVQRLMQTVRLGEGVDQHRKFSEAALGRTFTACREYGELIDAAAATRVRFVATSASRDAQNREVFINGVKDILGVEPEVISGDEESRLSFQGALASHADEVADSQALVVDIGGGSTEFVRGVGSAESVEVMAARSVDIGCVRMTERHLASDPPTQTEIVKAIHDIDAAIAEANDVVSLSEANVLVGVAGSVTTVAAMALGLPEYDADVIDGSKVSAADVSAVTQELLAMTRTQRSTLGFMHPGRIDVIGGGALVLDRIVKQMDSDYVLVSEHDILDGIAWSIANGS